jgi:FkbM family methyltransferase
MNELKDLTIITCEPFNGNSLWVETTEADGHWRTLVEAWPDLKRVLETYTTERRTIISAGAHIGMYVAGYADLFKVVYAFEPHPLHFYCLVNNVQFPHVIKIQAGVGEKASMGSMVGNSLGAWMNEQIDAKPYLPIVPIDAFQFPAVDVIQLDVEGYELRALTGAIDTITTHHPLLIIENGHEQNIVDFLRPLGYTIVERMQWDTVWKWIYESNDEPKI